MKKGLYLICLIMFSSQLWAADLIITKNNRKYYGTVVKRIDNTFVIRTVEGTEVNLNLDQISEIHRGDIVLDFKTNMRYKIEKQRPLLPLAVLGIATGVYAINQYGVYQDKKEEFSDPEDTRSADKYLAYSLASALVSVGSFYFALKPVEVRVPHGQLKISANPTGFHLAYHF